MGDGSAKGVALVLGPVVGSVPVARTVGDVPVAADEEPPGVEPSVPGWHAASQTSAAKSAADAAAAVRKR